MNLDVCVAKRLGDFSFASEFSLQCRRVGIFGPSGSGKSTLMHMLAGLLKPDRGHIRLGGETLFDAASGVHCPPDRRRIGVVFQHAHLFPHLGVQRNLLYGYKRLPRSERKIDPEALIEVLNLGPLLERQVTTLSGGERQRVALGRTVLSCPRLILMDEPLNGLDESLKYQIIPYLKKVFAEFDIPLLFISHSLNEMRLMTDHILEFANGRLSAQGCAHDLALRCIDNNATGYANLFELREPRPRNGLFAYPWGEQELLLTAEGEGMYELSSREITLFKRHPEAISARNLLHCRVVNLREAGNRIAVELDCRGRQLVSQVVEDAAQDLGLQPGVEVFAAIKASGFRKLY
jgi:molybdate transport system ATP-binding protein